MATDYWSQFQPVDMGAAQGTGVGGNATAGGFQPSGGAVSTEPIKVGGPANAVDPTNPNAQLAGGTPQGGTDYRAQFMAIMGGLPATPENLASKEKELQAAGFRVVRSGDGTAGKVAVPGGQIFDVIQGAHAGGGGSWQWLGGGGGGIGSIGNFQTGTFTGGGQYPLASVMGPGLAQPWTTPFNAPDPNSVTNDKALQWQMGRGMDAIQRSAASKGTLLTGGVLKSLDTFGQGLASTYYSDVYNRALSEYKMAHDIYNENQGNLFQRLGYLGSVGENAAAGVGNAQIGAGNAQGQGSIAQGNIWGNAVSGAGNLAGGIFGALNHPPAPTAAPPTGTSYVPGTFYPPGSFTP